MLIKIRLLILIVLAASIAACGSSKGTIGFGGDPNKVLATVNGQSITEKDVIEGIQPGLKKFEMEIFKMEEAEVNNLIDEKLVEQAAKSEGKSVDDYLENYVKENSKEPTEDEIKRFYEFKKQQMGDKKFDDVKSEIAAFIKANQANALQRKLISSLRAKANIEIKMEPPRIEVKAGDSPSIGPKNAPVTIIEYSDYQCPFCGRARPTINQIIETYPEQVRYVFKDFPLSFHKDAQKAHEAAHCAGDQGKYWEMNKEIFANQRELSIDDLKGYAKKIGLDMSKFDKCLSENTHEKTVKNSLEEGMTAGVSGTPAFFVNGIMISGARPFPDFKQAIDAELNRK